ncbi:hypothetical protein B0T22DRAFT_262789 [Podospora appendiculata]|uniref:Uncharacterized protein n=1 Tax=Podospora appendiculata TaxID=314037 RepID=A0AAE1C974_9PEZI|nr:hypothetical protein B0T22DRAFT_262789 [Podospora appendiculata]
MISVQQQQKAGGEKRRRRSSPAWQAERAGWDKRAGLATTLYKGRRCESTPREICSLLLSLLFSLDSLTAPVLSHLTRFFLLQPLLPTPQRQDPAKTLPSPPFFLPLSTHSLNINRQPWVAQTNAPAQAAGTRPTPRATATAYHPARARARTKARASYS